SDSTTAPRRLLALVYLGVPLMLVAQLIAEMIFVGLTSEVPNSDEDREWLGRAAGLLLMAGGRGRKFGGNHRWRNLRLVETKPKSVVGATVEITPCRRIARKQCRTYCWVPSGTTASRPVYERRSASSSNRC